MIKIKKQVAVLLCCVCLLFVTACENRTDVKPEEEAVYCLNQTQTGLVRVAYEFPDGDVETQVAAVLKELAKPAENIEYTQVLSEEVQVNQSSVKNVIANVDFNEGYLEIPSVREKLVRAAVVYSLLQLPKIQGVWLTVNGKALKNEDGTTVGVLNEDDFVENTGPSVSSYQTTGLTLYFANKTGDKLVEQNVNVRYSSNIPIEKIIVEKLMQGPKGNGCYPTLNPAATLLSVTIKDGVCYVNFDSEFLNSAYDVKPEIAVYSLVNSLLKGTSAGKVQIAVNGVTDVLYKDAVDLSQAFQQNLELVEGEKQ